jgi:hypothetical protein
VDSLNGSIHLRTPLLDIFLVDEIVTKRLLDGEKSTQASLSRLRVLRVARLRDTADLEVEAVGVLHVKSDPHEGIVAPAGLEGTLGGEVTWNALAFLRR